MSRDDDLPEWFSESSNSADDRNEPRHLEAVAGGPESDDEWFDQAEATPSAVEAPPARDGGRKRTKLLFGGTVAAVLLAIGGGAWAAPPPTGACRRKDQSQRYLDRRRSALSEKGR